MKNIFFLLLFILLTGCHKKNPPPGGFFEKYEHRRFQMGFTTWPYARTVQAVDNTYRFLADNTDIYAEHIDHFIPWNAWINNNPLPAEFVNTIQSKARRKIPGKKLLLSVGLLNNSRDDLMPDYDGTVPVYSRLDDSVIVEAYYKHVKYLTDALHPDKLVIAIEVNKLLLVNPGKWQEYKSLISQVKMRIKQDYPSLPVSESIMLHVLLDARKNHLDSYINEIFDYTNGLDFTSISFYPFSNDLHTAGDFQQAFDFLHRHVTNPIAIVETGNISRRLTIPSMQIDISGNEAEQRLYLEKLCINAQEHSYDFIIWWTHRDYTALWQTFPPEIKDMAGIWLSTGLLRDDGSKRPAYDAWRTAFETPPE
jgi:hypothetical protein